MNNKLETTDVVFRKDTTKDFEGTIFALFPHECADYNGLVTHYTHVGQHSSADYKHCIATSVPATEQEYADLKAELEAMGYFLNVVKRQNYNKFLTSFRSLRRMVS